MYSAVDNTQNLFMENLIDKIKSLSKRIESLESSDNITIITKSTTGIPASGMTGQFLINTFDKKAYIYAASGWREIVSW